MSEMDPVLVRLSGLGVPPLEPALSERIGRAARARLVPRPVPTLWTVLVSASVVGYLGWALAFTSRLFGAP